MGKRFIPAISSRTRRRAPPAHDGQGARAVPQFVLENAPEAGPLMERYEIRFPNITLLDRLRSSSQAADGISPLPGLRPNGIGLYCRRAPPLCGRCRLHNFRPYLGLSTISEWQNTLRRSPELDVEWIIPATASRGPRPAGGARHAPRPHARPRQELIDAGGARRRGGLENDALLRELPIDNTRRDEERTSSARASASSTTSSQDANTRRAFVSIRFDEDSILSYDAQCSNARRPLSPSPSTMYDEAAAWN